MTETTATPADNPVRLKEDYWSYRVDFAGVSARTDTPDLMRVFSQAQAPADDAAEWADFDREAAAAQDDLAAASFETWPED